MSTFKPITRIAFLLALLFSLLSVNFILAGIGYRGLLIMFIILTIIMPMGLHFIQGKLDLFEPLVLANIALGVMFIGRPLADIASGMPWHLGYDITSTFDEALLVVLIGILAFQLGYHSVLVRTLTEHLPAPSQFYPQRTVMAAWLFFILGGVLFSMFLLQGGGLGLLLYLLQGRDTGNNVVFLSSSGYFYQGILMWTASALIFFAMANTTKQRSYYVWFTLMVLPLVIFFGARGTRSQLLPLIIAVPTFWYLWRMRRPTASAVIVAIIISIAFMGFQREMRTVDSVGRDDVMATLMGALSSPIEELSEILNGADNEMFDSITSELLIVPASIDYRPLGTITDLFIRAVPRPIWPNKPLETNDTIVSELWPEHYYLSRASPAFSIIGPFYYDSGYPGVAIGMFIIGLVLASSWRWYLTYNYNLNALMIYSMGLPFVVILMRGTLPDTLSRMLFMVIPLILSMWLSRFRFHASAS